MRFIDEVEIRAFAGNGGDGCIAFRREKFIPRGGPNGGDGGKGGDVWFESTENLSTLRDLRFKKEYKANSGNRGLGSQMAGKDGEDIVIPVPVGTLVKDSETGEIIADLNEHGQTLLLCKGGRGGRGNMHFATSERQVPKFAEEGKEGDRRSVKLELKLIADVGIIGFPNAGKSTLISKISSARPKIADYAFTTLVPNLGVVEHGNFQTFVVADIPGLVEGAHRGMGLGHRFLKHIERTRVFIHLLDGTKLLEVATMPDEWDWDQSEARTELDRVLEQLDYLYSAIRNELKYYNPELLNKPEIIVLNKSDLFESNPALLKAAQTGLRSRIQSIRGTSPKDGEPFIISCATGTGVNGLLATIVHELEQFKSAEEDRVKLPDELI